MLESSLLKCNAPGNLQWKPGEPKSCDTVVNLVPLLQLVDIVTALGSAHNRQHSIDRILDTKEKGYSSYEGILYS